MQHSAIANSIISISNNYSFFYVCAKEAGVSLLKNAIFSIHIRFDEIIFELHDFIAFNSLFEQQQQKNKQTVLCRSASIEKKKQK